MKSIQAGNYLSFVKVCPCKDKHVFERKRCGMLQRALSYVAFDMRETSHARFIIFRAGLIALCPLSLKMKKKIN